MACTRTAVNTRGRKEKKKSHNTGRCKGQGARCDEEVMIGRTASASVSVSVRGVGAQEALARQTEAIIWGDGAKLSGALALLHAGSLATGFTLVRASRGAANKNS